MISPILDVTEEGLVCLNFEIWSTERRGSAVMYVAARTSVDTEIFIRSNPEALNIEY